MHKVIGEELIAAWRAANNFSTYLGVVMIGVIWLGVAFHLSAKRQLAEAAAIKNSGNLARAFQENVARSIKEVDRVLLLLRDRHEKHEESAAAFGTASRKQDEHLLRDIASRLGIMGADGFLKQSSGNPVLSPVDLRDRAHYQFHLQTAADELFIGSPVLGRRTDEWVIPVSRRIRNQDGSFGGVIAAMVDQSYFTRYYNEIDLGLNGAVALVGLTDGIFRASENLAHNVRGQILTDFNAYRSHLTVAHGWYFSNALWNDGIRRLVSYRTIEEFPLVVLVGISEQEIFATIGPERVAYKFVAILSTALILLAIGFNAHREHHLAGARAALQSQNLRFDAALNTMSQGLCMYDADSRLLVCNDHYGKMYRLPPELLKEGTPLHDIVRYRILHGIMKGENDQEAVRDKMAALSTLPPDRRSRRIEELADGTVISITRDPMEGGGWVSTHEDITEQTCAERELDRTKRFLDIVIEKLPLPVMVKDPATSKFLLLNQAYEKFIGITRDKLIGVTASELFPSEVAELIKKHDTEALQSDERVVAAEFALETPFNGTRVCATTRLVVHDSNDKPQYLIIVIDDVTERKKAESQVAYMAHHDPLTGLPNRTRFSEQLAADLKGIGRSAQLAVLFLDLDHFKHVNDTLGHLVGDELLKIAAERLQNCIRDTDTVARLGGDEFAIIQTAIESPNDVANLAHRIQTMVKAPYDLGNFHAVIDVSIGIALAPGDAVDPAELMRRADLALYKAKADGRGTWRFFEPDMDARMKARRRLEIDLRAALAEGGLELFYQPVVALNGNEIVGLEALLRWHHPERGMISPGEFIPIAEETGLIIPLGEWVIRQACADAVHWPPGTRIAVNLSPVQFRSANLIQVVTNALATSGVVPSQLELEITEEVLLTHNRENLATLEQLRALGVRIVMDDFGTGYSSLNYLRRFPFDKIKIDRSFINDLAHGTVTSLAIVEAVAKLAKTVDMSSTAEGVETEEQLEIVRALGCTEYQGYLFSPPKPVAEIVRLFRPHAQSAASAA